MSTNQSSAAAPAPNAHTKDVRQSASLVGDAMTTQSITPNNEVKNDEVNEAPDNDEADSKECTLSDAEIRAIASQCTPHFLATLNNTPDTPPLPQYLRITELLKCVARSIQGEYPFEGIDISRDTPAARSNGHSVLQSMLQRLAGHVDALRSEVDSLVSNPSTLDDKDKEEGHLRSPAMYHRLGLFETNGNFHSIRDVEEQLCSKLTAALNTRWVDVRVADWAFISFSPTQYRVVIKQSNNMLYAEDSTLQKAYNKLRNQLPPMDKEYIQDHMDFGVHGRSAAYEFIASLLHTLSSNELSMVVANINNIEQAPAIPAWFSPHHLIDKGYDRALIEWGAFKERFGGQEHSLVFEDVLESMACFESS